MAYYFMVEKKKGEYQSLNIENVAGFHGQRKYTKPGAYTLQEIDMFTTMFNNEEELRNALISSSVLSMDLANKSLSTRWVNKGKYNKVPYDFLYQKDLGYILDPYKLIDFIMNKYNQWDFVFIKKFADYFSMYRECSSTAPEVRMYADMSIREGACCRYFEEIDLNGDNQVKRLVKLLLFEYYENPNGKIDYKNKINYRNLHAMIAFINNYNKKTDDLVNVKPVSRTRTKKNEIPGQISIFDMLSD